MASIVDVVKKCDSWGEVEDSGRDVKEGRYCVRVFFDSHEEADDFRECIMIETNSLAVSPTKRALR